MISVFALAEGYVYLFIQTHPNNYLRKFAYTQTGDSNGEIVEGVTYQPGYKALVITSAPLRKCLTLSPGLICYGSLVFNVRSDFHWGFINNFCASESPFPVQ